MGGFSSVTGLEAIVFADNASFDGTQRGGALTTDGQLFIGSTASPHIKKGSITSPSSTVSIGYSSPNITIDVSGSSVVSTLTPNSGTSPVTPTGGTINVLGTGSTTTVGSLNTLTVELTGLTNHAVLVGAGTATITNVGPTATAGQILQSLGSTTDPAFSTATYPSTTTINQILYSSAANVVGGLATANDGVLTTNTTGTPVITPLALNGQLIIGSGSGAPAAATLTAGTGVSITNGANSITINATSSAINYTNVNTAASPYTVLVSDYYISVDCSGGTVELKFPNVPAANRTWIIKDRTGSASTNNIYITTVGGAVTIDGQTTYLLSSNYGAVNLLANATPTYEVY